MKLRDIINELTFHGRLCTKDCSGHKAGWEWERKNQTNQKRNTPSNSFNTGTEVAIAQRQANKDPIGTNIRGEKGRFQKFQQVKEDTLMELFDNPVNYAWDDQFRDYKTAVFKINNQLFKVGLTRELVNGEDLNVWDVEFKDMSAADQFGITGKLGRQSTVLFATVIAIVMEFKNANPEATIKFTAKEPSRQKLYNRILGMLQQKGFQVKSAKSPDGKMGYLVR